MRALRLGLAQLNPTVGDIDDNEKKIIEVIGRARDLGVDVLATPELAVCGYPPEDLLLKPQFAEANRQALSRIALATAGMTVIVGFVDRQNDIYNAAAVLHDGCVAAVYHKAYLPNYAVFDEDRYFMAGARPLVIELGEAVIGVNICEDIWSPSGPTELEALAGAQLVINISASPYYKGKIHSRERMWATRASDNVVMVAVCCLVGGQDELIFDGGSVVIDPSGEVIARGRQFVEELIVADLNLEPVFRQRLHDPRRRKERLAGHEDGLVDRVVLDPLPPLPKPLISPVVAPLLEPVAEVYQALVLGTRDYMCKNGFRQVVIGLSGGVDSALTAAIAVDALGTQNVRGVFMPSQFSSTDSREDAEELARRLDIAFTTVPIQGTFEAYLEMLAPAFDGMARDVTEENLQARIRGNILMAISNKFRALVLTTGNKSELATGYCTLYGDMAGGFAVIKDVPKTLVYALCNDLNERAGREVIPQTVIEKPPSAELAPGQLDSDSLPPYDELDPIVQGYVEDDLSVLELIARGHDAELTRRVARMVDRNEYKRRQAAPGVRVSPKAFGKDRRLPITNRWPG
jgi:NAD+ synthase (glutamine-hydrolysing)